MMIFFSSSKFTSIISKGLCRHIPKISKPQTRLATVAGACTLIVLILYSGLMLVGGRCSLVVNISEVLYYKRTTVIANFSNPGGPDNISKYTGRSYFRTGT